MDSAAADDGRIRTGTFWSAFVHAFTAAIGSAILALPWSLAQLGWIVGTSVLIIFPLISYYTSSKLCDCYRAPDPVLGTRNNTYMDAVKSLLGPKKVLICGVLQYVILWGTIIGYTITTVTSMMTLNRSTCSHKGHITCEKEIAGDYFMLLYGGIELILSQCPNLEKATSLSVIASVTSILYSCIAIGLSVAELISSGFEIKGSILFNWDNNLTSSTHVWHVLQALGSLSFAFTFNTLLLEIQDTLKSPPPENKVMRKVIKFSLSATAFFFFLISYSGYAAYGNSVPGNILSTPSQFFWLIDIANLAVVIHLAGAYQVFAQPIFALHERLIASTYPTSILNRVYTIKITIIYSFTFQFTLSRILLRSLFVMVTTLIAMMFPFFNAVLGLLGSISFWPLTVYFPLTMYQVQAKVKKGSFNWVIIQVLVFGCFAVAAISAVGSVAGIFQSWRGTQMFHVHRFQVVNLVFVR